MRKRILGIDYGTKRVGVAVSDENREFALPVSVITSNASLVEAISKIAVQYEVKDIVIGESRDYKGVPNPIFAKTEELKHDLEQAGYRVYLELEFMTSMQAERLQGKHDKIDASAAALILQSYLDRNRE